MINELKIENFRGFRSLELKDLKRVNLIVGHNNSGKTSLLEAVRLLCDPAKVAEMPSLFRERQGDPDSRYFRWLLRDGAPEGMGEIIAKGSGTDATLMLGTGDGPWSEKLPCVYRGQSLKIFGDNVQTQPSRVVPIQHVDANRLVALVGQTHRKAGGEETLQRLLAKVDPRIRKIRIDPGNDGNQVIVDIGLSELVPISQAGQGVYRLVAILADIIGEKPDVLLIDEIENGLHHSVHRQIWTGLGEVADQLGVQIFATTHSDECLRAAHTAFSDRIEYDFSVIQLFRVEEGAQGRVLDRELIEAAIAGNIDLR